ncbi:MAG: hypothetical protein GF331_26685 [Chitinivibrionales bacterium]|nr:hypothetical protein [Chitinivibrionales bacterium]
MRHFLVVLLAVELCRAYTVTVRVEDRYSGIRLEHALVAVDSKSPGASPDTAAITDSTGAARFSLDAGLYEVFLTRDRYATDSLDLLVTGDLDTTIGLEAEGSVHTDTLRLDTLYRAESPYYFRAPLHIPRLYIESGVTVVVLNPTLDPYYSAITVDTITAAGAESDSIVFTSENGLIYPIRFAANSSVGSFRYCVFNNTRFHVTGEQAERQLIVVDRCRFADGVLEGIGGTELTNSILDIDISAMEECFGSHVTIEGNVFLRDFSVSVYFAAAVIKNNNFFCTVRFYPATEALHDSSVVRDNIFHNIDFETIDFSEVHMSHNLFLNYSGDPMPAFGNLIMTNANGDSCDAYYNVFGDPLIEDTLTGRLAHGSPAVHAASDGGNIGVWQGIPIAIASKPSVRRSSHACPVSATMEANRIVVTFSCATEATGCLGLYDAAGRCVARQDGYAFTRGTNTAGLLTTSSTTGLLTYRLSVGGRQYAGKVITLE